MRKPPEKQIASVAEAARHFGVDRVTIRRWIQSGCPCLRHGRRGPGHGALLDLQRVAQWRGIPNAQAGLTVEEILQRIAVALNQTLFDDRADIRAGIDRADGAVVLIVAFERCCKTFGQHRFEQSPPEIRTLMSVL